MESRTKLIIHLSIFFILTVGFVYIVFFWNLEEKLNPPLNAICQGTAKECYSQNPVCKTFAIEGKNCVRDGMTGGILDNNIYYICEGYGKMTNKCQNYYSYEGFQEWIESTQLTSSEVKGK